VRQGDREPGSEVEQLGIPITLKKSGEGDGDSGYVIVVVILDHFFPLCFIIVSCKSRLLQADAT
jgi:hypothetical protein